MSAVLSSRKLTIGRQGVTLQQAMDLTFLPGKVYGLLGRNGTGKSTLLHTLAGLIPAISGDVFIKNQNIKQLSTLEVAKNISLMLQHDNDSFPCSLIEYVLTGRYPYLSTWQGITAQDEAIACEALRRVGLWDRRNDKSHQLSGGQRRRLSLAVALAQQTPVLLLDEPLGALDLHQQLQLLDLFNEIARDTSVSVVLSLHDINLAARYTQELIFLFSDGCHQIGAKEALLQPSHLQRLLGEAMYCQQGVWLPTRFATIAN